MKVSREVLERIEQSLVAGAARRTTVMLPTAQAPSDPGFILRWPYPIQIEDVAVQIVYQGQPLPKERPRFSKGGTYTATRTKKYEKALANLFQAATRLATPDRESRFGLRCLFYRHTAVRVDTDNLVKAVQDAANQIVWHDDSQVAEVFGRAYLKQEQPRVEVLIYRLSGKDPSDGRAPVSLHRAHPDVLPVPDALRGQP